MRPGHKVVPHQVFFTRFYDREDTCSGTVLHHEHLNRDRYPPGGAASHAAIIAREYGIPAVMGAAGASNILRDGELITVNGSLGMVVRDNS